MSNLTKSDLRREAQSVRANLPLNGDEADAAAAQFMAAVDPEPGAIVAVYLPLDHELDTAPLIDLLRAAECGIALPVVLKPDEGEREKAPLQEGPPVATGADMIFRLWPEGGVLSPGVYTPAPEGPDVRPDIILCPLLAFDRRGTRLGRGGGHYDRALAHLQDLGHKVLTIGYGYAQQICLFPLPREDHDIRMDMIITPQDAHDFRA